MDGIIFDSKEFAVYDGPGIRQTIFFKGCPLRCRWCHNPEGLEQKPQLMVSTASCIHCGKCDQVCGRPECNLCGKCIGVCPLGLRRICGETVSAEELVRRIRKDADYYRVLGGGVTFSGGEPLMQGEFLLAVLEQIPDVHCALETCGYTDSGLFQRVAEKVQFLYLDSKLMDPELHRTFTGVDNKRILENLSWLCGQEIPFSVRIPLIPGVNDNEENFRAVALTVRGAKALQQVELLPYHKTAGAKYSMVGKAYEPGFDTDRPVRVFQQIFEEYGVRSNVL